MMSIIPQIKVENQESYFDTQGMFYKEFKSHYELIRYYALLVVQKCPPGYDNLSLLEQQISEIIKNAIKHGNKSHHGKIVKVWFQFDSDFVRIIVEDEGKGFKDIEKWNEFQKKRVEAVAKGDFNDILEYASFKHEGSAPEDGGNALFAAVEFWNGGYVFNSARNKVSAIRLLGKQTLIRQS